MSIRQHIINNFKGDDYETLRRAIDESVKEQDEVTLPGLGVFLEIIWENADNELKDKLIEIIKARVQKGLDEIQSLFYSILLISLSTNPYSPVSISTSHSKQ